MTTLVTDNSIYTHSHEIAPALQDVEDEWHKDTVWMEFGADTCGDDAIGACFTARYWRKHPENADLYLVVDEYYYVEQTKTYNQPEVVDALSVKGLYHFTVCRDLDNVGMTEEWATIEYDDGVNVFFHYDLAQAEEICRKWALSDQRFTLTWMGDAR